MRTILVALAVSAGATAVFARDAAAQAGETAPGVYIVSDRADDSFTAGDRFSTAAQATPVRGYAERFVYARLGYGGIFGDRAYGRPGLGIGYRIETDALALDASFLNVQGLGGAQGGDLAMAASLAKLQVLVFLDPSANASAYVGGGLSWGGVSFGRARSNPDGTYRTSWNGTGLQGELTAGYELPRASPFRIFVEVNGVLPFYRARSQTFSSTGAAAPTRVDSRYAGAIMVSVGLGWQP